MFVDCSKLATGLLLSGEGEQWLQALVKRLIAALLEPTSLKQLQLMFHCGLLPLNVRIAAEF